MSSKTRIDINDQTQFDLNVNRIAGTTAGHVLITGSTGIPEWGTIVIPDVPVTSVNGMTGDVIINADVVSVDGRTGIVSLTDLYTPLSTGITSGQTANWNTAYSWGDHAGLYAGINNVVNSFNGATGAVIGVNSVNGSTGIVDLTETYLNKNGDSMVGALNMAGYSLTGIPSPILSDDAATKAYVDNRVTGISWKEPVKGFTGYSDLPVGVLGDRYVITGITYTNDIAEKLSGGWTFLAPQDNWSLMDSSNDAAYTYDATTASWIQFSGAGQVNAGVGLSKDGNTLNINLGAGIAELPDDNVGIDLYGIQSGLMLTTDGVSGSTGSTAGLAVKVDAITIDRDLAGLHVVSGGITGTQLSSSVNSDISKGVTAYSWGNHADAGYATLAGTTASFVMKAGDVMTGGLTGTTLAMQQVVTNEFRMGAGASAGYVMVSDSAGNASWVSAAPSGITAGQISSWDYIAANGATTGYVNGLIAGVTGEIAGLTATYLALAGGTLVGELVGTTLTVNALTIPTGAVAGYVLTSDSNGVASWKEDISPANIITSVDGRTGAVSLSDLYTAKSEGVTSGQTADWNTAFSWGNWSPNTVHTFNGVTGDIIGVNSVNGVTGAVSFEYVSSFNGHTGAIIDGVTLGMTGNWNSVYSQVGTIVVRESPSGAVDGSNREFVLLHEPMAGTEEIYLNGLLQEPNANDYSLVGVTFTFVADATPPSGSRIRASYRY